MKLKYIILLIGLTFIGCQKDDVKPNANCWLVVQVFGWTELPSNRKVVEITIEKDGIRKEVRAKGYEVGDYYCR